MPPKKSKDSEVLEKISSLENILVKNNEMVIALQQDFCQIQEMLRQNTNGLEAMQKQMTSNHETDNLTSNATARESRSKIPVPTVTGPDGKLKKRKLLKRDILQALSLLNPDVQDTAHIYETIRSCAYYRVKSLISVTYKNHPPSWSQVLPCYRREIIDILNARVLEMDVDLSLCEEDWVALYLVKRCYQNKEKYMRYNVLIHVLNT